MDFCVLVLWLHRFHKEFYVPDTESQKSALSSVVSKFSSKVAKRKKKVLQLERLHSSRLPRFSAHDGGAVRCCWHLGAWAHSVLWHVTAFIFKRWKHFARRKKRTHECHLFIFLGQLILKFLFLIHICKPISPSSGFWFSLRLPLIPPVLTADVPPWF